MSNTNNTNKIIQKIISDKSNKVYMDMDGVLAIYEREAYQSNNNETPLFMIEDKHYFRSCKEDNAAIALLLQLKQAGVFKSLLTAVAPEIPWAQSDKIEWVKDAIPEIDTESEIIIATSDKAELVKVLENKKHLTKNMILIDDYNPNLNSWVKAGGTAIKYINGINNPDTFDGPKIYKTAIPARV